MKKIFLSGSCRIKNLKEEGSMSPYSVCAHHTHTTKECIQYLNYTKGLIDIPDHLENKIFQSYIDNIINEKPIVKINKKKLQNPETPKMKKIKSQKHPIMDNQLI